MTLLYWYDGGPTMIPQKWKLPQSQHTENEPLQNSKGRRHMKKQINKGKV